MYCTNAKQFVANYNTVKLHVLCWRHQETNIRIGVMRGNWTLTKMTSFLKCTHFHHIHLVQQRENALKSNSNALSCYAPAGSFHPHQSSSFLCNYVSLFWHIQHQINFTTWPRIMCTDPVLIWTLSLGLGIEQFNTILMSINFMTMHMSLQD